MTDFTRSGHVTLGHTYRDQITGFVGVACGRHQYLTGCVRFALEAKAEEGKVPEEAVFDEGRLEEVVQSVDAEGSGPGVYSLDNPLRLYPTTSYPGPDYDAWQEQVRDQAAVDDAFRRFTVSAEDQAEIERTPNPRCRHAYIPLEDLPLPSVPPSDEDRERTAEALKADSEAPPAKGGPRTAPSRTVPTR